MKAMTAEHAIPNPPSTPGPLDLIDAVYRALLAELVLCSAHRRHLTGASRGFTPEQIERRGYRSMPSNRERRKIVDGLLERFTPEELVSVPGFVVFLRKAERYITLTGSQDAILCPIRDQQGRILSFQIRDMKSGGGKKKNKYVSLSSRNTKGKAGRLNGPGPGLMKIYPVHLSKPMALTDRRIWITEGIFNGDYAADALGAVVVSVLGVNQFRRSEVDRLCRALTGPNGDGVVLAYDADKREKPQVAAAESELIELLSLAGLPVEKADWDESAGKGLDDLLRGGGKPMVEPADPDTPKRSLIVPPEIVDAQHPSPLVESTLEDAQDDHHAEILAALQHPEKREQLFLGSDCGTGKTHGVMSALEEHSRSGQWGEDLRVLYVVDTKEQIKARLAEFPWLEEQQQLERLTVRLGRDKSNCEMANDLPLMARYGEKRQSVATRFCSKCASREDCGYQAAVQKARQTPLTIATKDAMFKFPSELKSYSVVIVDEDLLSACLLDNTAVLRISDIDQWIRNMDRIEGGAAGSYPQISALRLLLAALSEAIQTAPEDKGRTGQQYPLIGRLEAITGSPEALRELVENCHGERQREPDGFAFERSFQNGIPLRLCGDLLDQLDRETDGEHVYTKLWMNQEAVQLAWLRADALEALMGRTLINLDATPAPHLIDVFPNARMVQHNLPQGVRIHQITDSLYTRSGLRKDKTRTRVQKAIDVISEQYERPIMMTYKEFSFANPAAVAPLKIDQPDAVHGYFGRHDRALNVPEMMAADALIIAGTPYDNIAATRRIVHALLFAAAPRTAPTPLYRKSYLYKDEQEYGRARKLKIDPDPHVQAAIDHQVESRIWQSIGRLRAVRRLGELIDVWLMTAYPIRGLPVEQLHRMHELIGSSRSLEAVNKERAEGYQKRAKKALEELEAENKEVSRRALRKKIGGSDRDAAKIVLTYKEDREAIGGCGTHTSLYKEECSKPPVGTTPPNELISGVSSSPADTWTTLESFPVQNGEPEFIKVSSLSKGPSLPEKDRRRQLVATLPEGIREEYEERAAIMEYDAGFTREEAEKMALAQLDDTYRIPHIRSCHACGRSEWWLKPPGRWACGICHPKPIGREAQVVSGSAG
jgi:hypothetical protein